MIHPSMGYFDPDNRNDNFNNKAALQLLERHRDELDENLQKFTEAQIKWRCDRRTWEYELIKWLYAKHTDCLVYHKRIKHDDLDMLAALGCPGK